MSNILSNLSRPAGANRKRKRVGRGCGSGHGKTSCRGHKGAKSRSGYSRRAGFEGGQMPLIRRIPKRGFTSRNKKTYQLVNLRDLAKLKVTEVQPEKLKELGLIKNIIDPVKILGTGEIKTALTVKAHAFSQTAIDKIAKAGGQTEVLEHA